MGSASKRLKRILIAMALLVVLLSEATCGGDAASPTGGTDVTDVTVPPPGSTNQGTSPTDITIPPPDSPATAIYQALGWESEYVVYRLEIENGWAYLHAIPFTTTEGPTIDTRALLRQTATGEWQVLEVFRNDGLLTDVGHVAEDEEIPNQLRSKYPDAPPGIFPSVRPQDRLIMNAVRTALGSPDYRFNVFAFGEDQGWAYTELRALRYQEGRIVESQEKRALLQEVNGTWRVLQMESLAGTTESGFVASVKQQYPDVPAGILPEPTP